MKIEPSLQLGPNHTGIAASPERRGMLETPPDLGAASRGSIGQLGAVRARYTRHAGPIGTLPSEPRPESSVLLLLDLLGARLAFERTSVRFYEALVVKHDSFGAFGGGPDRHDIEQIRDEEHQHMRILDNLISDTGGDPTATTPAANLVAIAIAGLGEILVDPRTSLLDGLDAMLIAELIDRESWTSLIEVARDAGKIDLAKIFHAAETTEEEHLRKIRRWVAAGRAAARAQLDGHER